MREGSLTGLPSLFLVSGVITRVFGIRGFRPAFAGYRMIRRFRLLEKSEILSCFSFGAARFPFILPVGNDMREVVTDRFPRISCSLVTRKKRLRMPGYATFSHRRRFDESRCSDKRWQVHGLDAGTGPGSVGTGSRPIVKSRIRRKNRPCTGFPVSGRKPCVIIRTTAARFGETYLWIGESAF